ncbi:murein biosynthesis integral membrane protein MurJ [Saliniramus sp.]|uniref:murein biosynthesis integral membrane protein MurJ n=1 Tax=Saliniramus sp. TaxID=2986772 RepID=UPI002C06A406|nr:murein biosynthesis integral membrane protein MurJ [Saliniramus sp.]HMB10340.1 murein biosynthesis integral membrane protein MurJ [Saliniramus sp.]
MLRKIASVGSWTMVSRITGFARDVVMAGIMGVGPVADAFVIALRLPNHFRTIFGEGAFNAAFIPTYAQTREKNGNEAGHLFASRIWTLLLAIQIVLLALALAFMPWLVSALAPGVVGDDQRFDLTVTLTRITFPYLLFVTLVTMLSALLNAHDRFAAAAAAPILLNGSLIAALALAFLFPTAGHAAAWGVALAGVFELLLVWGAARRAGLAPRLAMPRPDKAVKHFFKTFGPAVIGSAGVQIAMFADTIIASLMPVGAVSALYYADRLYQLPVGVIGIAAGTVLLPEMSRRIAEADIAGAHRAQNQAAAIILALALPCTVAFVMIPDLIMLALFGRGAFTAQDAAASGAILAAYALALPAVVLMRSALSSFYARSDTVTPLKISLTAVAVNIAFKIVLTDPFGVVGLALATAIGAWVNLGLLLVVAQRRSWSAPNALLGKSLMIALAGCLMLAALVASLQAPALAFARRHFEALAAEGTLAILAVSGGLVYGIVLLAGLRVTGIALRPLRRNSDRAEAPGRDITGAD